MHNGAIADFGRLGRELSFALAPELYTRLMGTTDSEVMFYLALTFGLQQNPIDALERMSLGHYSDDARAVVSEPFGELSEYWEEIGESTVFMVEGEEADARPFEPRA